MSRLLFPGLLGALALVFSTGCEKRVVIDQETGKEKEAWSFTGQPDPAKKWVSASKITDFTQLYSKYCIACHRIGSDTVGPAVALDNPAYLSVVPADVLRNAIANGVPGSLMPGFSKKAGGDLTDAQVDALVKGILAKNPAEIDPAIPAYAATPGDPAAGRALFEASVYAKIADPRKSLLSSAFLGTVSDQYVRTLLIAGLPALGYPDYRGIIPGKSLSTQEISDLTAWIISHRENEYGQSAPASADPSVPSPSAAQSVP